MRKASASSVFAVLLAITLLPAGPVLAATPQDLLLQFEDVARQINPSFRASAARGESFYRAEHPSPAKDKAAACASCHSADPRQPGRTPANKQIDPLAPAANPARFTVRAKVDKWFGRNCGDGLGRDCTAAEKADFIAWLANLK